MDFESLVDKSIDMLRRRGRITYRALRRQFELDEETLADLRDELIKGQRVAADEDGEVMVWVGEIPAAADAPPEDGGAAVSPAAAERRHITVLFCDLADSTELSERLDPEDLREVVGAYQTVCAKVVRQFDGHVAQFLGDGVLVYFGYPRAHEDDARRAVLAGLGIVEALAGLNDGLAAERGIRLALRVGIHTGIVVVGEVGAVGHRENLALGDTPNIAARVQGLAPPDSVLVSAATHRLCANQFEFEDLGPLEMKGVAVPMHVHRAVGARGVRSASATAIRHTPLVGRAAELDVLLGRWRRTCADTGQVVLLSGEPGIGKSRLVFSLTAHARQDGADVMSFHCSPYHSASAMYPVIDHLERALGFDQCGPADARMDRLEEAIRRDGLPVAELAPLFAAMLSLPAAGRYPEWITLTPERQRARTQEALLEWFSARARSRPALMLWEDLHWADPSSLELLSLFLERATPARLMVVLTFRPSFHPAFPPHPRSIRIDLSRMPREEIEAIAVRVAGGRSLPPEVLKQIVEKTDGVPLFAEEVTKLILESGYLRRADDRWELSGPLSAVTVPATLRDSLMARLDRLAPAREVAQLGAVIGREFSWELLRSVSTLEEGALVAAIDRLVESEMVHARGVRPNAVYGFEHVLVQDVAYESLLKSTRQTFHRHIARVIEERYPETAETQPELLARHLTGGGLVERAIPYWRLAGERAVARSAHAEAIAHLSRGLELVRTLPQSKARLEEELSFEIRLGAPLTATKGYGAQEVHDTYTRAREISRELGDPTQLFGAQYGLWRGSMLRAEYATARAIGDQVLELAEACGSAEYVVAAHRALGGTLFYLGELDAARIHLDAVISATYDPDAYFRAVYDVVNPRVACRSYAAWVMWVLGDIAAAKEHARAARAEAEAMSHPFSIALATCFGAWLHQFQGDPSGTRDLAETGLRLSLEHGFGFWVGWCNVLLGWADSEEGRAAEAVPRIRTGLADWRAKGSELGRPYFLQILADVLTRAGQTAEAYDTLAEAESIAQRTSEHWWMPEILRQRGELLLREGPPHAAKALACLESALETAQRLGYRSLAIRAALSLATLPEAAGRRTQARTVLAAEVSSLPAGADGPVIHRARELLASGA